MYLCLKLKTRLPAKYCYLIEIKRKRLLSCCAMFSLGPAQTLNPIIELSSDFS